MHVSKQKGRLPYHGIFCPDCLFFCPSKALRLIQRTDPPLGDICLRNAAQMGTVTRNNRRKLFLNSTFSGEDRWRTWCALIPQGPLGAAEWRQWELELLSSGAPATSRPRSQAGLGATCWAQKRWQISQVSLQTGLTWTNPIFPAHQAGRLPRSPGNISGLAPLITSTSYLWELSFMNIHEHPISLEVCPYKSRSTSLFLSPTANPDEYFVVIVNTLWDMGAGAAAFKI